MSFGPTLSIRGLYNWDDTIFDDMVVPESVDKENVIGAIFMECSELEVVFPDPDIMKWGIKTWSKKMLPRWERIANVLDMEYNPIENYDRQEAWTDDGETNSTVNSHSESDRTGAEQSTSGGDNTLTVAGYNSNEFANREKQESSSESGTNSVGHGETDGATLGNVTTEAQHRGRVHGNIGVTTSQQMLKQEVEVADINLEEIIMQDFKKQFCLCIY